MKAAIKVGDIVEAHLKADIGNLLVCFGEQVARAADAHTVNELSKTVASGFFKEA